MYSNKEFTLWWSHYRHTDTPLRIYVTDSLQHCRVQWGRSAHPFSSSHPLTPPLPTKAPLPSSFFPSFSFKSIFRLLVGKPDTRVIKITHSAVDWPDISIQGQPKICIPFIFFDLLPFCVSSTTLKCQKVTFEINQIGLIACNDSTHTVLIHSDG